MPIIAPVKHKKVEVLEREALKTRYSNEFLTGLMGNPDLIRNVAIVGHLHHGKTLVGIRSICMQAHCCAEPVRAVWQRWNLSLCVLQRMPTARNTDVRLPAGRDGDQTAGACG